MKRCSCFILSLLILLNLDVPSGVAQRISPAASEMIVQNSPVQSAAGKTQLYCGHDGQGRIAGCWNKDKYDQWAAQNGQVHDYHQSDGGPNGVSDYHRQHIELLDSNSNLSSNGHFETRNVKQIILSESTSLQDPKTGVVFQYNFNASSGQDFRNGVSSDVAAVASQLPSAIDSFNQRQQAYDQIQNEYQDFYNRAAAQNAAIAQRVRADAQATINRAQAMQSQSTTNVAAALASLPIQYLSRQQFDALKKARELIANPLAHHKYEMNKGALDNVTAKIRAALDRQDLETVFDNVESFSRAEIDGQLAKSKSLGRSLNTEGVVNLKAATKARLSGPYDNRGWQTSFTSVEGEIVRRIANTYQLIYAESNGLRALRSDEMARYLFGQAALSIGDRDIAAGLYERGSGLLTLATHMAQSIGGEVTGMAEGLAAISNSVPEVLSMIDNSAQVWSEEPARCWRDTMTILSNMPEIASSASVALTRLVFDSASKYQTLSPFEQGRMVGRAFFEVATLVATFGEETAIQASANIQSFEQLAAKVPEVLTSSLQDEAVAKEVANAGNKIIDSIEKLPTGARNGFIELTRRSPEVAAQLEKYRVLALNQGAKSTANYIEKLIGSDYAMKVAEVEQVALTHAELMKTLKSAPSFEFSEVVSRGAKAQVADGSGGVRTLTSSEVLSLSPSNLSAEHHFTIGGALGEKGMYYAVGSLSEAEATIAKELRLAPAEIVYGQTELHLDKVLDLTRPEVLGFIEKAGIPTTALDNYNLMQALGNAARESGYEATIFESSKNKGAKNIVQFIK